jgi:hypothetical protein
MKRINRADLIDDICDEIERVFAPSGFDGEAAQYIWLEKVYSISEEDDIRWQHICELDFDDDDADKLDPQNSDHADMIAFLADEPMMIAFLVDMLAKYCASDAVWSRV